MFEIGLVKGAVCEAGRNPVHSRRQPVVSDGVDSQRGRGWRYQGSEDQRWIRQLVPHVPELGLSVDGAAEVERTVVVLNHHQRRTHHHDEELRGQRLAVWANLGRLQLPVIYCFMLKKLMTLRGPGQRRLSVREK